MTKEKTRAYNKAYRAAHLLEARTRAARYRATHSEKIRAYQKAYYATHSEEIRAYNKTYDATHSEERRTHRATHSKEKRVYRLRNKYGLTPLAFESILAGQGGVCAICKSARGGNRGPVVDHDHVTGRVRGILCNKCNQGLGLFGDNILSLKAAILYLEEAHV
jgi:hypothetical protein